jgi:Ca-activated chloride channel homolog
MKTLLSFRVSLYLLMCVIGLNSVTLELSASGICVATDSVVKTNQAILHPISINVQTTIQDQVSVTTVRESFIQESKGNSYCEFSFPLPLRASVTNVRYWMNGNEYNVNIGSAINDTSKSDKADNQVSTIQQKFFEQYGYKQKLFSFPITKAIKTNMLFSFEISYIELLDYMAGSSTFTFPLKPIISNSHFFEASKRDSFTLSVLFASSTTLDTAWCSSHTQVRVSREINNVGLVFPISHYQRAETFYSDFILNLRLVQSKVANAFYSNKPPKEDGHFVFILRPSVYANEQSLLPKVFTFILDKSGSMSGSKIQQAKQAASYCISHLNPQDKFNIVAFSDYVETLSSTPLSANRNNIELGLQYISRQVPDGGTNLQGAALKGLSQYTNNDAVNIIIFLTDGIATINQQDIQKANQWKTKICVFGIGSDVATVDLAQLASMNNGIAEFINSVDNTTNVITRFYERIRNPIMKDIRVSFSQVEVYDVLPLQIPEMNIGEQVVIVGRYKRGGIGAIRVQGIADKEYDSTYTVEFTNDSMINTFTPKIWAKTRIDYLLTQMSKEKQNSARWREWRDEIIRLGIRYGIVTDFTTYKDGGSTTYIENFGDNTQMGSAMPNPFTHGTTISYFVPTSSSQVQISIYSLSGEQVATLLDTKLETGTHTIDWDGRDNLQNTLPAGVYLCRINIDGTIITLKIVKV